jgi:flagellar motor switch protein FliM
MADSEVLSQDEIDALLSHVDSGKVEVGTDESIGSENTQAYDFTGQDRLFSGRMSGLEMINELFAGNLRASLFTLLRRSPEVSVESVKLIKYGEYVQSLTTPSNLNIVRLNPLPGNALIVCNPKLVFSFVECFFGGGGGSRIKLEGREIRAAEMRVVRKTLDLVFADLKDAWDPVLPIEPEYVNSETNPQFVNLVRQSEVVVVSTFHIGVGGDTGYMALAIPYSALEPFEGLLNEGGQNEISGNDAPVAEGEPGSLDRIRDIPVTLSAEIGRTKLSIRNLLQLNQGSVVELDRLVGESLDVHVNGTLVAHGEIVVVNDKFGIRLTDVISAQERVQKLR